MNKILSLTLLFFFTSCSTVYLDQYQGNSHIELNASYDTEKSGIALVWGYPEESVRMEVSRGATSQSLGPIKTFLGQKGWLDTSVSAGTAYFYRVRAFNPQGRMVASSSVVKGLRAYQDDSVPVPSNFRVELGSSLKKISLAWIGAKGQSYRLYRSLSADAGYHLRADLTDHFYQDSGLAPDTSYYYKLSVVYRNASGAVKEKFYGSGLGDISGGAHIRGKTLSDIL